MKAVLIYPLTKNQRKDYNIINNYRPVSNLTLLSKFIERAVPFLLNNNNLKATGK